MTEPARIDVWPDVKWPWRYIGERRPSTAIAGHGRPVSVRDEGVPSAMCEGESCRLSLAVPEPAGMPSPPASHDRP